MNFLAQVEWPKYILLWHTDSIGKSFGPTGFLVRINSFASLTDLKRLWQHKEKNK